MKIVKILLIVVTVFIVGVLGLQIVASESGEVVVLTTQDSDGNAVETRLWTVDKDGVAWLRSGDPRSGWYQRLSSASTVAVYRNGAEANYAPRVDVAQRDAINDLMREKYGWADAYIAILFGREDAIPIALDPLL